MKQKDLPILIAIVIVSAIFSLVLTQALFVPKKTKKQQVQIVPKISSEFQKPDDRIFNKNAINPTQLIQIGNDSNPKPF